MLHSVNESIAFNFQLVPVMVAAKAKLISSWRRGGAVSNQYAICSKICPWYLFAILIRINESDKDRRCFSFFSIFLLTRTQRDSFWTNENGRGWTEQLPKLNFYLTNLRSGKSSKIPSAHHTEPAMPTKMAIIIPKNQWKLPTLNNTEGLTIVKQCSI